MLFRIDVCSNLLSKARNHSSYIIAVAPLSNYDTGSILLDYHGSVALLRLNRPESLNALSRALINDLCEDLISLQNNSDVRVIVLTGDQKAFAGR